MWLQSRPFGELEHRKLICSSSAHRSFCIREFLKGMQIKIYVCSSLNQTSAPICAKDSKRPQKCYLAKASKSHILDFEEQDLPLQK